mmetsp:Transcript_31702/g.73537  ORF Transcript_31702/g.73537 Transcript_31702/m.73537 type:complete len:135 (-) Transcript_31702:761-1165(-)
MRTLLSAEQTLKEKNAWSLAVEFPYSTVPGSAAGHSRKAVEARIAVSSYVLVRLYAEPALRNPLGSCSHWAGCVLAQAIYLPIWPVVEEENCVPLLWSDPDGARHMCLAAPCTTKDLSSIISFVPTTGALRPLC